MKAKIIELDEIDSTNLFCKRYDIDRLDCDLIVAAKRQSGGRGTKGRNYVSEEGGLYLSIMRKLKDFDFANTFTIMVNACVAVCKTLQETGLNPTIKWANDVLVGGKKISGTLIENTLLSGGVCVSIVGIGINVNNSLPKELENIATSVKEQTGKEHSVKRMRDILIKNLQKGYTVEDYKRSVDWFGQEVELITGDERVSAVATDVDNDGSLVCNIGGALRKINSAEMSLRLKG